VRGVRKGRDRGARSWLERHRARPGGAWHGLSSQRLSSEGGGTWRRSTICRLRSITGLGMRSRTGPRGLRRDDVTLANPFGPPVRGWAEVSATLDRAAENYQDGEAVGFENVSTVITPDLAYTVELESYRARVGGAEQLAPVSVRVTTGFRREDGVWKVVHRHADAITAQREPESVIQTS
jgi:ketosteroid isomerase-like protein